MCLSKVECYHLFQTLKNKFSALYLEVSTPLLLRTIYGHNSVKSLSQVYPFWRMLGPEQ